MGEFGLNGAGRVPCVLPQSLRLALKPATQGTSTVLVRIYSFGNPVYIEPSINLQLNILQLHDAPDIMQGKSKFDFGKVRNPKRQF